MIWFDKCFQLQVGLQANVPQPTDDDDDDDDLDAALSDLQVIGKSKLDILIYKMTFRTLEKLRIYTIQTEHYLCLQNFEKKF